MRSRDEPCPKCGATSTFVAPETVDIGVGEIPIEPDSWTCQTHGKWCWMGLDDLRMEFPDGPPNVRSTEVRIA